MTEEKEEKLLEDTKEEVKKKLKEPEIKTMKRDLARLRLQEAEDERARIIGLQKEKPEEAPKKKEKPKERRPAEGEVGEEKLKQEEAKGIVEEILKKEGVEKKKGALEDEKRSLHEKLRTLREREKEVNKEIQDLETRKKAVQNKSEKENITQKQEELKKKQSSIQQEATQVERKIKEINRELAKIISSGREKEEKPKEKTIKEVVAEKKKEEETKKKEKLTEEMVTEKRKPKEEKVSDIERAKRRLKALSVSRERGEKGREEDYKESLEKRWQKEEEGEELPEEVKEPVKEVREYPKKPSRQKRKLARIFLISLFGLLILGGGTFAYLKFGRNIVIKLPVLTCGGYKEKERCLAGDCYWYDNSCHRKEKEVAEKRCEDYAKKDDCQSAGCFWYGACFETEKQCAELNLKDVCQEVGCYWYDDSCHREERIVEEPSLPPALIPLDAQRTAQVENEEEVREKFKEIVAEDLGEGKSTEVLFKSIPENEYLNLEDFFSSYDIPYPEELFKTANEKGTLFIHSSVGRNRFGFVTKVEEPSKVSEIMGSWEETMEKDMEPLLSDLGKEEEAIASDFRETSFYNTRFKYLTISKDDFGLCHTVMGDYLIFTTSFAGMKDTILGLNEMEDLSKKAGQLFILGIEGTELTPETESFLKKYKPGGVLLLSKNIESEDQLSTFITDLQDFSRREIGSPLFIAVDQEGEPVTRIDFLEEKTAQRDLGNAETARTVGRQRGEELKELGVNLNLAPLLDVTNEGDFIHPRTFQKSEEETGVLAKAMVEGQSQAGILTAIKHFPGYDGLDQNPEEKQGRVKDLPPISQFQKAMEADPEFVMTSNVIYEDVDPEVPFTFSEEGIALLRQELGSEVLVLSDDLAQTYLLEEMSLQDIVAKPLQAGVDSLIFSGYEIDAHWGPDALLQAIAQKKVSEQTIEEAYARIMRVKQKIYY